MTKRLKTNNKNLINVCQELSISSRLKTNNKILRNVCQEFSLTLQNVSYDIMPSGMIVTKSINILSKYLSTVIKRDKRIY